MTRKTTNTNNLQNFGIFGIAGALALAVSKGLLVHSDPLVWQISDDGMAFRTIVCPMFCLYYRLG